jgi:predicted N-acetyltransferase YhbS
MEIRNCEPGEVPALERLFASVFTASEGEGEGARTGMLVRHLIASTDPGDLHGFRAIEDHAIVGAVFFSRLACGGPAEVFLLSPLAVDTGYQGRGVGQALIRHSLRALRDAGVSVVTTYGDPAFCKRPGFEPLSADTIPPPYRLSRPEGWLGQSLTGESIEPIAGRCHCLKALEHPAYW